jgi:PEP-CTERM motif
MQRALRLGSFVAVVCLLLSATDTRADSLQVQVGYVDQYRANGPSLPTPWCNGPLTHFDGSSPNDGCSQSFDAGAIRLDNSGSTAITITDVAVSIGDFVLDLWNQGGAFQIQPGSSEILSQLTPYDFDTSDTSNGPCCTNDDGIIPTITITFDGATQTFLDSRQVLNTGGFDKSVIGNESSPWQNTVSSPEPSTLALLGVTFLSLFWFWRYRRWKTQ